MRRGSLTPLTSQSSCGEPVIVVDDTGAILEEEAFESGSECRSSGTETHQDKFQQQQSLDVESPTSLNPYLLSPWRDPRETRKHSLPTPQCSGITASQVRRLSDRGGEGPSPREAAFLATLSTAPAPSPGGRRHSVVTISKVPTTLFGRNRRESIAAYPSAIPPQRILGARRESIAGGPPSTEHRGSIHNLQLDIMDDIVTARKARVKIWSSGNEQVCEVQPLNDTGNVTAAGSRFTASGSSLRRCSDLLVGPLPTIPADSSATSTNSSLLSSLASSATEIDRLHESSPLTTPRTALSERKRNQMRESRSNSFDATVLKDGTKPGVSQTTGWFAKRHQPMTSKVSPTSSANIPTNKDEAKKLWDSQNKLKPEVTQRKVLDTSKGAIPKSSNSSGWYSTVKDGDDDSSTCGDSSLCSTLKDLFVK